MRIKIEYNRHVYDLVCLIHKRFVFISVFRFFIVFINENGAKGDKKVQKEVKKKKSVL